MTLGKHHHHTLHIWGALNSLLLYTGLLTERRRQNCTDSLAARLVARPQWRCLIYLGLGTMGQVLLRLVPFSVRCRTVSPSRTVEAQQVCVFKWFEGTSPRVQSTTSFCQCMHVRARVCAGYTNLAGCRCLCFVVASSGASAAHARTLMLTSVTWCMLFTCPNTSRNLSDSGPSHPAVRICINLWNQPMSTQNFTGVNTRPLPSHGDLGRKAVCQICATVATCS